MKPNYLSRTFWIALLGLTVGSATLPSATASDLLKLYPTTLTAGDTDASRARPWEFSPADIFALKSFRIEVGPAFRLQTGPADLGIGRSKDGAVWAVLIPRDPGKLTSSAAGAPEEVAHVWLRFHPKEISRLFPPDTLQPGGSSNLTAQMRLIAAAKFTGSWHAGMDALIPEPKRLTIDADTSTGLRRFFDVDTDASNARYVEAFERRALKPPPAFTESGAIEAFDALWEAFDREYAMFVIRPDVDWPKLRDQYRPKAVRAASVYEFAEICADMLRHLRDLHVWLKVSGVNVPVFDRVRVANANPSAHQEILGELNQAARGVTWAITADQIGYLGIYGWNSPTIPERCDEVLEQLANTRGLIIDVRLNGGGSEDQARKLASRFVPRSFVYGFSQFRNGPDHRDLGGKMPRTVSPRGPWRYSRPVVVLIGEKCMSSNESFVAMMSGDPEATIMGDHTCGSSGNPRMVDLPLDMTVSVPRWIDYLPDGSPLDEKGFIPQVTFQPKPGSFEGKRDDLLVAALERLRKSTGKRE